MQRGWVTKRKIKQGKEGAKDCGTRVRGLKPHLAQPSTHSCHPFPPLPFWNSILSGSPPLSSFAGFSSSPWPQVLRTSSALASVYALPLCALSLGLGSKAMEMLMSPFSTASHPALCPLNSTLIEPTFYNISPGSLIGFLHLTCWQRNLWFQIDPLNAQARVHTCTSVPLPIFLI